MVAEPVLDQIADQDGVVWLLVIVAALFPTELGTAHVADSTVATAVAAVLAAVAAALVVLVRRPPVSIVLVIGALCTAGAAAIHFAVTQQHFEEWWGFGIFFFVAGWVQLLWAAVAVRVSSRRLLLIGFVGNLGVVVLWVLSRTVGLPFGPEPGEVESVGLSDLVATGFEVVGATCCLALLLVPIESLRLRLSPLLSGGVVAAVTTLALLEAASGHGH